jgi:hypothetical protein
MTGRQVIGWRGLLLLATVMAIAGCAYELVRAKGVDRLQAQTIEAGLERIRGLNFIRPVPLVVESSAGAQRDIAAQLERDVGAREFRRQAQIGAWLGLYPPGIELRQQTLALLKDQVAGFYDPDQGRMILVRGAVKLGLWDSATQFLHRRDLMGELLLAHELTHALQDQHFDLKDKLAALKDNDDRALALKSVAEGDATITGFAYINGGMGKVQIDQLVARLSDLPRIFAHQAGSVPEALRAPMAFEYSAGVRFVAAAIRRGGWPAVNALYTNPPQSSQQILHPALYFDYPAPPSHLVLRGYRTSLPQWQAIDSNTLGEFMLGLLLRRTLEAHAPADEIARAWAADRMVILTRGDALSLIWLIQFRDPAIANRFATLYGAALTRRLSHVAAMQIEARGSAALLMVGAASAEFARVREAVFARSDLGAARPLPRPPAPSLRVQAGESRLSFSRALEMSSRSLR